MFGEFLIQRKAITEKAFQEGLSAQKFHKRKLGRLLRDLGYLTQLDLNHWLNKYLNPATLKLSAEKIKKIAESLDKSPLAEWARKRGYFAVCDGTTEIMLLDQLILLSAFDDQVLESIEQEFHLEVKCVLIATETLSYLVASQSGSTSGKDQVQHSFITEGRLSDDQKINQSSPYPSLFRDCVQEAKYLKASDIHIQPTREGIDIRLRVNGDMQLWKKLSSEHRQSFINEAKKLCNLSIAVSGKPQDSRISFKDWKLDIRVNLLPSQFGEKIVLRLLDLTRQFNFAELELNSQTQKDLKAVLNQPNGLIIVSGPTGSGKTTTLYTLLASLDREGKNIITLEDPIEYSISGLTQVQVGPKLTFADALRAVLRQDPDIILLGEIRDAETADLCLKASATGHLVLSTLHANSAVEVISRLINLGVDEHLLKSCLKFSSAQRLVKKLCPECSFCFEPSELSILTSRLTEFGHPIGKGSDFRTRNPLGCHNCTFGISGRVSILEYISQEAIVAQSSLRAISKISPTLSLNEAYLSRAEKGEVDANDVFKIA